MAQLGSKSNLIYLTPTKNGLEQRLHDDYTGDCIKRKLTAGVNEGKIVNVLQHLNVSGYITNIGIKQGDYGNQIQVTLDDEIQVQFSGMDFMNTANTIISYLSLLDKEESFEINTQAGSTFTLYNLDIDKEVKISSYTNKNTGYCQISFTQGDNLIGGYSRNDSDKGCPKWTKKTVAGKTVWNSDDSLNWYFEGLSTFINEYFSSKRNLGKGQKLDIPEEQIMASTENPNKDINQSPEGYANLDNQEVELEQEIDKKKMKVAKEIQGVTTENKKTVTPEDSISISDIPF